jgi:hypothetical protein
MPAAMITARVIRVPSGARSVAMSPTRPPHEPPIRPARDTPSARDGSARIEVITSDEWQAHVLFGTAGRSGAGDPVPVGTRWILRARGEAAAAKVFVTF